MSGTSADEIKTPCDLYRFFNRKGDLLYVGISANAAKRMAEHRKDKPWWHEVKRVDIERYPSRHEAADAERLAIRTEHPKYNIVHAVKAGSNLRQAAQRQVWVCHLCDEAIRDGDGYLEVDQLLAVQLIEARARERAERNAHIAAGNLVACITPIKLGRREPRRAYWRAIHRSCDTDIGGSQYWIGVERIRTIQQLLDWNAHLGGKDWLSATDWHRFIQYEWAKDAA